MNLITRFKFFLWYFGHFKVAMIGYVRPKIMKLDDQTIIVKVPLRRRTRNHLNSMYFGALSVGADIAGGLHGFYHAQKSQQKVSLAFKSFEAKFLKRPESDVYFVCSMGEDVKSMIESSSLSKERVNQMIEIKAYTHYFSQAEEVAHFRLELSLKVI